MMSLLGSNCRYLLDSYEYDQNLYPGPPHSVSFNEIQSHYGNFRIQSLILVFKRILEVIFFIKGLSLKLSR